MPSTWFRELVTGMTAITCFMVAILFISYIIRTWRMHRLDATGWLADCGPAMSITVFMLGASIVNGTMWYTRHLYNLNYDVEPLETPATVIITVGLAVKVAGGLWIIREFTPVFLGQWPWVVTAAVAIAFGILLAFGLI